MMQPLEGIRIIDLTQALAGPYCTMLLGDLGADVIKVEPPGQGDMSRGWGPPFVEGESAYFLSINRNKRGLTVNFKTPEGQHILHQLAEGADVFIVSVPRMESLRSAHIDPDTLRSLNPRLIYCAISGYGFTGPKAGRGGYDVVAQGEAGLMSLTGEPEGGPIRFPTPMADISAGIYATIGILSALLAREKTGRGQFLDVALLDSQVTWLANVGGSYFATGQRPPRMGNVHPTVTPYQPFRTRDKHIIVAVGTERLWQRFCALLGVEDSIMVDPRFVTNAQRNVHRAELIPLLQEMLEKREADYWLEQFLAEGIPAGPINFPDQTLADPQLLARGMIVELEHPLAGLVRSIGNPLHLSETPVAYRLPPPLLGEHNDEVLSALGYDGRQVEEFREQGII
ncbi:MAG: CoA transferase [Chloroflexi bacterium]|nr:CoA transferase [Chloroflexota bacterium]